VCAITDIQLAKRDNDDQIRESRSVLVSRDGHRNPPKSHFGKLFDNQAREIAAKSLVLKDFSDKSFKLKDFARISRQIHDSSR
jgi:hypothetical protein